jgi:Raf kinase inhibitor-like YbhB/YbcL family protein
MIKAYGCALRLHRVVKADPAPVLIAWRGLALGAQALTVISPSIEHDKSWQNARIFTRWYVPKNESPALKWSDLPNGTKRDAVTVYDPDVPACGRWWHWVVGYIPAQACSLSAGAGVVDRSNFPGGALQLRNDFGYSGFGAAHPPKGSNPHNAHSTVYALNTDGFDIPPGASPAYAGFLIFLHKIGAARLTEPTNAR